MHTLILGWKREARQPCIPAGMRVRNQHPEKGKGSLGSLSAALLHTRITHRQCTADLETHMFTFQQFTPTRSVWF